MNTKQIFQEAARKIADGEEDYAVVALQRLNCPIGLSDAYFTLMTPVDYLGVKDLRRLRVMILLMAGEVLGDDS